MNKLLLNSDSKKKRKTFSINEKIIFISTYDYYFPEKSIPEVSEILKIHKNTLSSIIEDRVKIEAAF
jgi:excinuclease UvrABC helicase subunit UvrB